MSDDLHTERPLFPPPGATGSESDPLSHAPPPGKFGQRMAEASWIACGLSILIGFFARMLNPESSGAIRAIALSNDALIALGFFCAVVALVGNRWWKNRDIVRPAMTGLLLSVALIALTGRARMVAARQLEERQREQQTSQLKALAQQELQAFLMPGWLAVYQADGVVLTLRSLPQDAASTGILHESGVDASILSINANNMGQADLTLDVTGAVLTSEDGAQQPSMDIREVLGAVKKNRDELLRLFVPPLRVAPGKAGSAIVFLPGSTDWRKASSVAVKLNGESHVIRGQFLTEAEKRQLVRAASQPATQAN